MPERQIVAVQERLSAGIGGERGQRFLRVVDGGSLRVVVGAVERASSPRARGAGRAARRVGHQAARVQRIHHHVGLHQGVDRGFHLRLVVDAGLAHASGNVHHHLLFRQVRQRARDRLQRRQLLIRVEDVELGLVGDEGRARILTRASARVREPCEFGRLADRHAFDHLGQNVAVLGEIGQNVDRAGVQHHRHDIVLGDALLEILQRGILRPQLVRYGHRGEIEEQHHQALVVILHLARRLKGDGGVGSLRQLELIGELKLRRRLRLHGQNLGLKDFDLLLLAVLGHGEIGDLEPVDGVAGLILHGHVHHHQPGTGSEQRGFSLVLGRRGGTRRRLGLRPRRRLLGARRQQQDTK